MNPEKPLIKLYRIRTFGEKMSDTFDFVRENWRPMLKYLTYLLLPIALVEIFASDNFMTGYTSFINKIDNSDLTDVVPWLVSMGVMMLFYYIGMMLTQSLTYTMMQLYEERQERLQGITFADLRPGFLRMLGRQLVLLLTGIGLLSLIGVVFFLFTVVNPFLTFVFALGLFALMPLLVLVQPVYMFEKIGVVMAYVKSVRLGWKTWAGIVGVSFVLYIMCIIVQSVVSLPWYIMSALKSVLAMQNSEPAFVSSFGYTAMQYVLGVVSTFCGSCLMTLLFIGIAYQYGHACDKVDGVSVDRDIENFETLNDEG